MMVFTSSAWTTSQCTFSGRSSFSQGEIGGSPATGGRSSPQQIHEEAVRQHYDQNAEAMRAVQMNAAAPWAHAAGSPIFMSPPMTDLPAAFNCGIDGLTLL